MGPAYANVSPDEKICSVTGAAAGADFVDGDTYLAVNFRILLLASLEVDFYSCY